VLNLTTIVIRGIAVGLVLQAAVVVALAWLSDPFARPPELGVSAQSQVAAHRSFGGYRVIVSRSPSPVAVPNSTAPAASALLPEWASLTTLPDGHLGTEVHDARGWPLLAVHGRVDGFTVGNSRVELGQRGVVTLPGPPWAGAAPSAYRAKVLPLVPIWSGFCVNVLLGAVPYWLLFPIRSWCLSARRHRLGRCVRCAYQVGLAATCPECGTPTKAT
jgi:hypothetical protein